MHQCFQDAFLKVEGKRLRREGGEKEEGKVVVVVIALLLTDHIYFVPFFSFPFLSFPSLSSFSSLSNNNKNRLSSAQYTSIALAGQSMSKVLLDTESRLIYRKGYVIGDGTGIGKGRQIAAIIADNWFQGRTRSVWISCSRSL